MESFIEINRLLPWFFPLAAAIFGACIGSFLNVCIYRIPKSESIVRPGSHCGCGQPIAWYDNLPVLSWLILRGRARCCGRPFSFRYPAIELLTAALFLGCWLLFPAGKAVAGMVFCSILICATFIDLDHMIIPDVFTIGGALTGVLLSLVLPALHGHQHEIFLIASIRSSVDAGLGLMIGSALVLWIALLAEVVLKKEAMGFGDVKFLGAIGAFIGWKGAVFAVFGGAVVGCVWFAVAVLWRKINGRPPAPAAPGAASPAPLGFGLEVPFGPMLAIAALIYFLALHRWVDDYFANLAVML
ncbi:MAG: prepilin peptidase [bacterium]|nr:prepilin peptidase [bacterium]MDI1337270.1 prepilin peptidase [Lacunisphaera sp.]